MKKNLILISMICLLTFILTSCGSSDSSSSSENVTIQGSGSAEAE